MLKKTIEYTDYNGNKRTEDFYFNLSKAELIEMDLTADDGMISTVQNIIDTDNRKELVDLFKSIILKAYGEKSADGKRFVKSDEISEAFSQTEAYSELFIELVTNPEAAPIFINGIIPQEPIINNKTDAESQRVD